MLVSTLRADIRSNLADQNITFYTDTDILDAIQDGCDQVITKTGLVEKFVDVPFQANVGYYDLFSLIADYYSVTQVYNNQINRWLVPQILSDYDLIRDDWEVWNGPPAFFTPVDHRRIVIVPRPPTTNGTMRVFYKARPETLTSSSSLPFPSDLSPVIEHYATADLLEQAREYNKAGLMWKDALEGVEGAARRTRVRSLPALIYRLREMRYGY
jgi:hypothetical protein